MSETKYPHFWIPDEEVDRVSKKLQARKKARDVAFAEHGSKLSRDLQLVKQTLDGVQDDDSLQEVGLYVFKVELPSGEKVQNNPELFSKNGMHIHAVKDERSAIVSTTHHQFHILKNRVAAYSQKGTNRTHFDYIDNISPYIGSEKNSSILRKKIYIVQPPTKIDIQLMLIPNLQPQEYEVALNHLIKKITDTGGEIQQEPYYLSDNTPVIRIITPSGMLARYENDSAIYRIEETRFFSAKIDSSIDNVPHTIVLNPKVKIDSLPIITILDSGVNFPNSLSSLIVDHWNAPGSLGGDSHHGTRVASRAAFSHLGGQVLSSSTLSPRARIVDCNILDGAVPENVLIQRIQAAVATFADISKIFNLSANASTPIEGDEMSIIGFEMDALQLKYGIQCVVSSGNHNLWQTENSLEDIFDDDDSKIAAPADSMLSIVVGSVVGEEHPGSLSGKNIIAPYSRLGPGFSGFSKPDMCSYGGTIIFDENGNEIIPSDPYSLVLTENGTFEADAGTSFTAPAVAGDLAEIASILPDSEIILGKALLYHNAKPLWETDDLDNEELSFIHNLYGRGISSVPDSMFSGPSKVTFVRTGSLNRITKERVKVYMPEVLAAQTGRNVAKVTVTCISQPPVDRTKGSEYLGAYIRASLKKSHPDGHLIQVNQSFTEGRKKWDVCHQFSKLFSNFNAGDWQIWLELFSRWDDKDIDVSYALAVTIEDVSGTLDVYSEVQAQNRWQALNTVRIKVDA